MRLDVTLSILNYVLTDAGSHPLGRMDKIRRMRIDLAKSGLVT